MDGRGKRERRVRHVDIIKKRRMKDIKRKCMMKRNNKRKGKWDWIKYCTSMIAEEPCRI